MVKKSLALALLLSSCSALEDEATRQWLLKKGCERANQICGGAEVTPPDSPLPAPTPTPPLISSPTPAPTATPEVPSSGDCGKVVTGHNYQCRVTCKPKGPETLVFNGYQGVIITESRHEGSCELKVQVPSLYSSSIAKSVKLCGPNGCAKALEGEWVNWTACPEGKCCAQWWRYRRCSSEVFEEIGVGKNGKGLWFVIDGHKGQPTTKGWGKEKRFW